LPVSRLQRDLSDSTVLRNLGVAFGYSLLAYRRIQRGVGKVAVNRAYLLEVVRAHPEVLAEAVQTILRRAGYPQPYEALKELTRGRVLTLADLATFIANLDVDATVKDELSTLTPEGYVGLAAKLARLREG
jgi:adenylosuccinate lyase